MLTLHRWLMSAALPLVIATAAAAQEPPQQTQEPPQQTQEPPRQIRDGFWFGVGFGIASNDLKCTGCNFTGPDDPWHGGTGRGAYYAGGWALSRQVLAGIELSASGTGGRPEKRNAILFHLQLVGHYYPSALGSFHVKGGIGPVSYSLEGPYQDQGGGGVQAFGWAAQVGVGYDIRVWRSFALAPYASITGTTVRQRSVTVSGSGGPVTRLDNRIVMQLGLGLRKY